MTTTVFRRTITTNLRNFLSPPLHHHHLSTTPPPPPTQPHFPKSQTPSEKQFQTWVNFLKPGFTPSDVNHALNSQSDPDLAFDIFRWTSHQRGYTHDSSTYLTMIHLAVAGRRHGHAEALLEEVLAGACPVSLPLYNSLIRFCCSHRCLFNRAFDVYKKMMKADSIDCKPNLETYAMLFNVLLKKFNKLNVSYVYLNAVRSLSKQMKALGVVPDTYVLNMIIKAYAKCLQVDEAVRVFREMGLYGCEPNAFSYGYLFKGCCEKGRVWQGFGFFKEMREKGLVPSSGAYMVLVCSLALERKFEDAVEVLRDMLENSLKPDLLTYRTLLEEMCRDGKGIEALELLEEFRKKDVAMGERTYNELVDSLHFVDR
ncbi:pentatricopeptide repeat-containing protein At3g25210, mitochondrial [Chenopodium quinoa]|uniref:pentatricopeptide repeat-containing protein At3g25210, mitochondrial n=1 Tax=Chenopodium quinoa TaxID=63459 RepID=UPI000B77578B|nr:pentatricopeptide repeat-containing protein At3g25210, mitochondrial [Chenopodium quinoa]